ncbi:unnamed protein product [Victoria cruziana]
MPDAYQGLIYPMAGEDVKLLRSCGDSSWSSIGLVSFHDGLRTDKRLVVAWKRRETFETCLSAFSRVGHNVRGCFPAGWEVDMRIPVGIYPVLL